MRRESHACLWRLRNDAHSRACKRGSQAAKPTADHTRTEVAAGSGDDAGSLSDPADVLHALPTLLAPSGPYVRAPTTGNPVPFEPTESKPDGLWTGARALFGHPLLLRILELMVAGIENQADSREILGIQPSHLEEPTDLVSGSAGLIERIARKLVFRVQFRLGPSR
jgi:hypothetical protein